MILRGIVTYDGTLNISRHRPSEEEWESHARQRGLNGQSSKDKRKNTDSVTNSIHPVCLEHK